MRHDASDAAGGPGEGNRDIAPAAADGNDPSLRLLRLSPLQLACFALLALQFAFLAQKPLWHTDLWGHLAYGRWIAEHQSLPDSDPFLDWAQGASFVDTAWLSQLIGYGTISLMGVGGIQWLYAGGIVLCTALLLSRLHAATGSLPWSAAGCALFLFVARQQLLIVRPQQAGLICFVALLVRMTGEPRRGDLPFVAVLFAAWCNLHGSFVTGWLLLAGCILGRSIDAAMGTASRGAVARNYGVRRLLLLLAAAMFATLLNPYGIALHREVWSIAGHPNLPDLIEWQPLFRHERQRFAFVIAVVALAIVGVGGRRRVSFTDVLLLIGGGALALWTSRMILWWAPLAGCLLAAWGHAWRPLPTRIELFAVPRRSWACTAAAVVVAAAACGATPLGRSITSGRRLEMRAAVSAETPVEAAEELRGDPPRERIFNTFEWGDYLLWAGPSDVRLFATSHVHLLPPDVWQDYLAVTRAGKGWNEILARRNVDLVMIDAVRHAALAQALRRHEGWRITYEDERANIFRRQRGAHPASGN